MYRKKVHSENGSTTRRPSVEDDCMLSLQSACICQRKIRTPWPQEKSKQHRLKFCAVRAQGQLPDWVKLPASVAIPFGAFEAALQDEMNADVSVDFVKLAGFGGAAQEDLSNLEALRNAVRRLRPPQGFKEKLQGAFAEEGGCLFWRHVMEKEFSRFPSLSAPIAGCRHRVG